MPELRAAGLALALLAVAPCASAADWMQAPGSTLAFAGKYEGDVFTGRFPGFMTTLSFDPQHLEAARLDVAIPVTSATTDNDDYDEAMRGEDFFAATRFPQAHYSATKFRSLGDGRFAADGMLSLHGVSRPVTLAFTWTPGAQPVLAGKATVKRLAFGIGGGDWADTGLIPDEIAVSTRVVFTPAK